MTCPKCKSKGTLVYGDAYQVCHEYKINNNGTVQKRFKKTPEASEEWNYIACNKCGFYVSGTDNPSFIVTGGTIMFEFELLEKYESEVEQ